MDNKHIVSQKPPIAYIGLVVSQELCWSYTWRVPGVTFPSQADAHPM